MTKCSLLSDKECYRKRNPISVHNRYYVLRNQEGISNSTVVWAFFQTELVRQIYKVFLFVFFFGGGGLVVLPT